MDNLKIAISQQSDVPIYQQIVDAISGQIQSGVLAAGYRLPTVRDFADQFGVSLGTVKHAYDRLGQRGLIEMTQGRGSFVRDVEIPENESKKERAMKAIDKLLDDMRAMSFSAWEIRIFFDLKMREREEQFSLLQIGAVDCSPEALSMMAEQLSALPEVEVSQYLLDDVLENPPKIIGDRDLIVTTATHFHQLENKVPDREKLMRIVLSAAQSTVISLARLGKGANVGIVCVSKRFAAVISKVCIQLSLLENKPKALLLGASAGLEEFAAGRDALIVPVNYRKFCSRVEIAALDGFAGSGGEIVFFDYQIDQGSFLYIAQQVERMSRAAKSRLA